jgi:putative tryptophan/tyrosine transport system substrate-binding protein
LLLEIIPRARRIALLRNALNSVTVAEFIRMRSAAQRLAGDFAFDDYPIRGAAELSSALETIRRVKPDALVVDNDPLLASKAAEIAAVGLPAISGNREFADADLLITYLRRPHLRHRPPYRKLYRPHPEGRQTRRSADRAADQIRTRHQPEDREGAWPRRVAIAAGASRRGDPMRRRDVIAAGLAARVLAPVRSIAQQQPAARMPRVGILTPAGSDDTPIFAAFKQALRELGYAEGRNIVLEFRLARGDFSLLPRLAAELVAEPVDVIVTDGGQAALVAGRATRRIPIVMGAGPDPVILGLASGHSHPGGNVTGFTLMAAELNLKRVELLRTSMPNATTIAVLVNPSNATAAVYVHKSEEAARRMGLRIISRVEPAGAEALLALAPSAFAGAAGVIVLPDPMFWNQRQSIISLINAARLPAVYPEREYADDGGLMAYGPSVPDNFRRAAGYVDRILKGTPIAELPIQEPSKFELVINLKTAKALGLTLPPLLLAQADKVIE